MFILKDTNDITVMQTTIAPHYKDGHWVHGNNMCYDPENRMTLVDTDAPDYVAGLAASIESLAIKVLEKPNILARIYSQREQQAIAYRDGGYTGTPGKFITNFAGPAKLSNKDAADLVLEQAAMLRDVEEKIEALRMMKNAVRLAATLEEAQAITDDALAKLKAIAAVIA